MIEFSNRNQMQGKTFAGNNFAFQARGGADEVNFKIRMLGLQRAGYGDSRVNMSPRSAAGNDDVFLAHDSEALPVTFEESQRFGPKRRDRSPVSKLFSTFKIKPKVKHKTTKELPP